MLRDTRIFVWFTTQYRENAQSTYDEIIEKHVGINIVPLFRDDDVIIWVSVFYRYLEEDAMIYITGDTHGRFERIENFCQQFQTSPDDILIILGDAGINFSGVVYDHLKKELLESLPITIFAIHGNHEQRPYTIGTYKEKQWHGGMVYYEEEFPSLLFAKDGEIFDLNGKQTVVIGGAYSIDKMVRVAYGWGWWEDEQPSEEIKRYVESQLEKTGWSIDVVLSHTTPLKYEPIEVFLSGVDQSRVDKSTEQWLDQIEEKLSYQKWYCGHYHTEKKIDRLEIMFQNFDEFCVGRY